MTFATLFLLALAFSSVSGQAPHSYGKNIQHFWGPYSPYFSEPSEISADTPPGYKITFAQVLSRHGARDPIKVIAAKFKALVARIHTCVTSYSKEYKFIKTYKGRWSIQVEYSINATRRLPLSTNPSFELPARSV
ncbi:phosphoglycerate mutase-like protein [Colletotrichum falcatum]|nr:phosphoglycerate mutase-like protein [Colletotrichum falcatum]